MKNRCIGFMICCAAVIVLIFFQVQTSGAEPIPQTITLNPGWNAVFLEVDPEPHDCAQVFASLRDLVSVWTWNTRISTVEYIQDPDTLIPDQPQWRVYFPDNPVPTNLYAIYGETAYLIKLGGTETVTWTVTGEPRLPRTRWKPDSFNFVGFHLDPGTEPFFENFFSSSSAHAGQEAYILNDQGDWQLVADPALTRMRQGEAFWVFCKGHSEFQGPLSVQLDQSDGLHYGKILSEQNVRMLNSSAADADISMTLTGEAPLSYWKFDPDNNDVGWRTFPLDFTMGAAGKETIRMGARRAGLTPNLVYESNLEITSNAGMRIVVPASVEGISHAGLWVGAAVIRKVSEPRVDPSLAEPVGTELMFRLILHMDDQGQARLLRQVIQMWDADLKRYVLFTDDNLIANYINDQPSQGGAVRRISSAAFSRMSDPLHEWEAPMTGTFSGLAGTLGCTIVMAPDDPLNPFLHRYHPDHKDTGRSYQVTRTITMTFSDTDADNNLIASPSNLAWGGVDLGGIYRETIEGLHRSSIEIEGIFLLRKVSSVDQLTR